MRITDPRPGSDLHCPAHRPTLNLRARPAWRAKSGAKLAAALALMLVTFGRPLPAGAHPADMYAQRFLVALAPDQLRLEWQILPGPFLADAVWAAADQDQSGIVTEPEAQAWIAPFVSGLAVVLDDQALPQTGAQALHWPSTVEAMRTGEDRIRFSLGFDWPLALHNVHAIEIHASHLEANSLNWFTVEAAPGLSFEEPEQANGLLRTVVHSEESLAAGAMTSWNSGTPSMPALRAAVSQMAAGVGDGTEPAQPEAGQGGSVTDTLTGLVKAQAFSPNFVAAAFLLSLVLGSLHALTPGHGKALVGAYLVGSQGRTRDAVFLGAIVTLTHTGSVVLLGLVTLLAAHYVLPALIAPWLEIISGVLVIGFGLNLLLRRGGDLMKWFRARNYDAHDSHHAHAHPHDGAHPHSHAHPHAATPQAAPPHVGGQSLPPITFSSLLALGISGGLVPCPDAIAILLVAVAVNRIPFGMLLILSFSIGLALVLIGIGIAMVKGVRLVARSEAVSRFAVYAPVVSAIAVISLGVALTLSALKSLRFGTQVVQSAAAAQAPVFTMARAKLLYIAPDSTGWDQLFLRPLSGNQALQYTNEPTGITGYSVSPDRRTIVYTVFGSEGGTAIRTINSAGQERRLILECPRSECISPRWYPDGTKLVYERLDDPTQALVPRFSLWWLDLAGGATRPLFQDAAFASFSPQFSPDGAWLSYISSAENTLVLFNLADSSVISLPLGLQASLPATWSPDSRHVLFGAQDNDKTPVRARAFSVASAGVTDLGGPEGTIDYSAAWSPDGSWIAIDRNVPIGPAHFENQVWLVRPDGTEAHVLLDEPGASYSSLAWSPDGRYLLYARYVLDLTFAAPGRFDIHMTDLDTGESQLLLEGGDMPSLLP